MLPRLLQPVAVARSAFRARHLIQQRRSLFCQPRAPPPALSVGSARALSWPARGGVKLVRDLKRNRQRLFCGSIIRMSSVDTSASAKGFVFGPYMISPEEVFLTTKLTFAFVNLRPVVPVARFVDLTSEEVTDLWLTAQRVGQKLEPFFDGSSLTLAIQDGPEAGQSVPHVHVHILPRQKEDFKNNDEIYDEIDKKERELGDKLNLDQERKDRTPEVMHEEATKLRALF